MSDQRTKDASRIHRISWEYCSIQKDIFNDLIPNEYRGEETDVIQFQVEKSKGRVIGYFDFNHTFQIILLDPAHNMQLSQYRDHKSVKTEILPNCYEGIMSKFEAVVAKADSLDKGNVTDIVREIKSILTDEVFSKPWKAVILSEIVINDINEILQLEPTYESLDFIIKVAIDKLKNHHKQ